MNNIAFEAAEKIYKQYDWYDITTHRFSKDINKKSNRNSFTPFRGGVPLMYNPEKGKVIIDSEDTHTIVFGATGSMKTRAIVMPTIKIMGYAGESMIINDVKGELYARLAGELQKNGYEINVIDFRDPGLGDAWNPVAIPYRCYLNGSYDRAAEFANDIANNLIVAESSHSDPFWDHSAADLFYGLTLLLFKYCKEHELQENAVNIGNLLELRRVMFGGDYYSVKDSLLWDYAQEDELIAASLMGTITAAEKTRDSILTTFDQKMRVFTINNTLLDMLASNTVDLSTLGMASKAVFLITPDEKTSYHKLVSLFIKQSYEYIIYVSTQNAQFKVGNRINFILDEFSSLPQIADMPSMISAARSRDIRFVLVIQSKGSLKKRYREEAETIISNCTNWVFFTSRELPLLKEISELCGIDKKGKPNISVFDLQHLNKEKREALILCGRLKPAKVQMLDIDQYGDRFYRRLHINERKREERSRISFTLSRDIADELRAKENGITSLDDLYAEKEPVKNIDESNRISEMDDIQKELEAKFDELFGVIGEKEDIAEQHDIFQESMNDATDDIQSSQSDDYIEAINILDGLTGENG